MSDCAGMSSITHALHGLGVGGDLAHVAACDKDATANKYWSHNYPGTKWYDDVNRRDYNTMRKELKPNVYECGFPCQPFPRTGPRKEEPTPEGESSMRSTTPSRR